MLKHTLDHWNTQRLRILLHQLHYAVMVLAGWLFWTSGIEHVFAFRPERCHAECSMLSAQSASSRLLALCCPKRRSFAIGATRIKQKKSIGVSHVMSMEKTRIAFIGDVHLKWNTRDDTAAIRYLDVGAALLPYMSILA